MSRLAPFAVLVPLLLALSLAVAASSPLPVELPAVTPSGLLMALGALLGTLTLLWNARGRMPLRRCALGAGLVLLLSAFLSHLTWCLVSVDSLEAYGVGAAFLLRPDLGGHAMYGAIAGGLAALAVWARVTGERPGTLLDLLAPSACWVILLGRVGEYFSGQGIGEEVTLPLLQRLPLAVCVWADADWSEWRLAVCFLEALTAAGLLVWSQRRLRQGREGSGEGFLLLLGILQIFLEQLRQDDFLRFGFVRFNQLAAAVSVAAVFLLRGRRLRLTRQAWLGRGALLLLGIGGVILTEFALEKPLTLPWLMLAAGLTALTACLLLLRGELAGGKPAAAASLLTGAAVIVLLALRLPWENTLLLLALALFLLAMLLSVPRRRNA